jgi:AcrR family transcriptional regulator
MDNRRRRPKGPKGNALGREALLRAGREELKERGLLGFSLKGVAERSGYNTGLIHYYYGSRAVFLRALLRDMGPACAYCGQQFHRRPVEEE